MKFWGILIGGLILGFTSTGFAQTDMSSTFSSDNKNILYSDEVKEYSGAPLVFIEGISDQPRPKDWKDELKIKLFGSMELPEAEIQRPLPPLEETNTQNSIKIRPLFGDEKEVAFVPHTSDWSFIIQVLNDEEIVVQEEIQFIKTTDVQMPVRKWAKQDLQMLDVQINGKSIPLQMKKDSLQLNFPELETGVHKIRLTYLIKKAGLFSKKEANISIALIDLGWNLAVNSLNGIVLFPVKIQKAETKFLLGKNHQEIKEAFEVQQDESGAVFFRATHLIPANSALQLNLDLTYDSFIHKGIWDKLSESKSFLIFIISLFIILGYLMLNIIETKLIPVEVEAIRKKSNESKNAFSAFVKRTGEIWIGLILLWVGTFFISCLMKAPFAFVEIQILFGLPIAFVLIMDYLLLYPRQETIKKLRGIK